MTARLYPLIRAISAIVFLLAIAETLLFFTSVSVHEPLGVFRRHFAVFQSLASVAALMAAGFMFMFGKKSLGCALCVAGVFFAARSGAT